MIYAVSVNSEGVPIDSSNLKGLSEIPTTPASAHFDGGGDGSHDSVQWYEGAATPGPEVRWTGIVWRSTTAQEISSELSVKYESGVDEGFDLDVLTGKERAMAKAIFALVNEVRDLKSQPAINKSQFLTWVKSL